MKKKLLLLLLPLLITFKMDAQELKSETPLRLDGNIIKLANSNIELDKNGFPKQIATFYNQSKIPTNLLYENIHFHFVRKSDGKNINLRNADLVFIGVNHRFGAKGLSIKWKAKSLNDSLLMEVTGAIQKDGILFYKVKVKALQNLSLKDVTMHIPFVKTVPIGIKGFGLPESVRPELVEWQWDGPFKNQNWAWLGNQDAGMKYVLDKGDWNNNGKGGVTVGIKGSSMLANNYTNDFELKKGELRHYNFQLVVKPLASVKK